MRKKRIITMLVAVMLLCAMAVSAAAVSLVEPAAVKRGSQLSARELAELPPVPEVTVEGNLVSNDGGKTHTGFFELSLYVSARGFQSAGVVLSYDATVLQPVDWTAGEPVAVTGHSWDAPAVLHTKGADTLSGKPALAYAEYKTVPETGETGETTETEKATGRANLYLGADTLQYTDLSDERVVTVRFAFVDTKGPDDVTMPTADAAANGWNAPYTVQLADSAAAAAAIPGREAFVTVRGETDVEPKSYAYPYQESVDKENGVEAGSEPQFRLVSQKSINQGSTASGDYAITFFDWDGRVIDAIAAPADARDVVAAWEQHSVIDARLKNKPGYEFDQWLVVYEDNDGEGLHTAGGTFTSNNTALDLTDATVRADVADLSNISGYVNPKDPESKSVLLQASYQATEAVNQGAGIGESPTSSKTYYTFSEPTFYQYGSVDANNGQYAVRYTVTRGSAIRAREPVVMALVYVGDKYLTVKVDLENTDTTSFEIVVPKATSSIQCQVLDASTNAAWIFGRPRNVFSSSGNKKIVTNGAFDRLMEEAVNAAASGSWSSDINTQIFIDAGYTGVNNAAKLTDAQNRLKAAVASNGGKKLNDAQANTALSGYGSFTRVQ